MGFGSLGDHGIEVHGGIAGREWVPILAPETCWIRSFYLLVRGA